MTEAQANMAAMDHNTHTTTIHYKYIIIEVDRYRPTLQLNEILFPEAHTTNHIPNQSTSEPTSPLEEEDDIEIAATTTTYQNKCQTPPPQGTTTTDQTHHYNTPPTKATKPPLAQAWNLGAALFYCILGSVSAALRTTVQMHTNLRSTYMLIMLHTTAAFQRLYMHTAQCIYEFIHKLTGLPHYLHEKSRELAAAVTSTATTSMGLAVQVSKEALLQAYQTYKITCWITSTVISSLATGYCINLIAADIVNVPLQITGFLFHFYLIALCRQEHLLRLRQQRMQTYPDYARAMNSKDKRLLRQKLPPGIPRYITSMPIMNGATIQG